jgi:hypothetical protein
MFSLKDRLEKSLQSWPSAMTKDFRAYFRQLHERSREPTGYNKGTGKLPFWLLLPIWLTEKYNKKRTKNLLDTHFLNDILWGQYCLFLSIRIKDDLHDRQAESFSLIFGADQFLIEAYSVFSQYMRQATPFWDIYRGCLEETTRGIVNVDKLQRSPNTAPKRLRDGYANVSSLFKIASAAVCFQVDRTKDFSAVSTFADSVAIAGQILDDLQDIDEDLQRDRFNYAAIHLLRRSKKKHTHSKQALNRITENMLYTNGINSLLDEIDAHILTADKAAKSLRISEAEKYLQDYHEMLSSLRHSHHRERVKLIFTDLSLTGPQKT